MTDAVVQGEARAALVERLAYMHNLLRFIDDRWQAKAAVAHGYQPPAKQKERWGAWAVVLWAVGLIVAAFTIASPLTDAVYELLLGPFLTEEWADANVGAAMAIMLAIPVAGSVAIALLVVGVRNKVLLPKQQANIQQVNAQRDVHNAAVRVQELQIDAQLIQAGRDYSRQVGTGFFPEAYLYEDAVAFCINVVQNHRANSVTEALNLFETELHRQRVENIHAQQLAEAERTRKQQAVLGVIQAGLTGAAIGTMRAEGKATRAANAANTRRITDELKKPVTVNVTRRNW